MLKTLFLAVLIAIVLTYSAGYVATEWFDVNISMAHQNIEPFTSILAVTAIVALLVVIGFIVAISIFAAIVFALVATGVGLFVAGLSVFWPVVLFAVVIFLLVRDRQTVTY